jgi:hypothetical protein
MKNYSPSTYWIYLVQAISKKVFFLIVFCFSIFSYNFANGLKNKSSMRITLSGNSIIFVKHKGKINSFYGCTSEKEEQDKVIIIEREKASEKEEKEHRTYQIDKRKLERKAKAFGALESSKKFIGFYSVSFPRNFSDENCRKCWNIWLTKLREKHRLNNYIWVAERQKNKTLHFHLLTNNRMEIRKVNYEMAKTIDYYVRKEKVEAGNFTIQSYNGVDLSYAGKHRQKNKKPQRNKQQTVEQRNRFITAYLAKYMSKQKEGWKFLPCHYSRSVSALATGFVLDIDEEEALREEILPNLSIKKIIEKDYVKILIPDGDIPEWIFWRLRQYNEYRYKKECKQLKYIA